ncbi:MAG: biotin transporter BioY [Actinobacteria bacterium]|nr:biotin transporter BioY [Actinomycetota bacterium]
MTALAESITRRANVQSSLMVDAVLVILGSLLMTLLAQLSIKLPFTPVPITGQTLGVLIIGGSFGVARGAASMALYLLFILADLPFGAGWEGGAHLLSLSSATGGYLFGFVIAAAMIGRLAERGWDRNPATAVAAFVLGEIIIFGLGVAWLAQAFGMSASQALDAGFYPFVLGDILKVLLAAAALPAAWRLVNRGGPSTE